MGQQSLLFLSRHLGEYGTIKRAGKSPFQEQRGTGGKRAAWGRRTSNHPRGKPRAQHQTPWGHSWTPCSCFSPRQPWPPCHSMLLFEPIQRRHAPPPPLPFRTIQGVDSFVPFVVSEISTWLSVHWNRAFSFLINSAAFVPFALLRIQAVAWWFSLKLGSLFVSN